MQYVSVLYCTLATTSTKPALCYASIAVTNITVLVQSRAESKKESLALNMRQPGAGNPQNQSAIILTECVEIG